MSESLKRMRTTQESPRKKPKREKHPFGKILTIAKEFTRVGSTYPRR